MDIFESWKSVCFVLNEFLSEHERKPNENEFFDGLNIGNVIASKAEARELLSKRTLKTSEIESAIQLLELNPKISMSELESELDLINPTNRPDAIRVPFHARATPLAVTQSHFLLLPQI